MNFIWTRHGGVPPYGIAPRKPHLYGIAPRMGVDGGVPPYAKYSSYVIQYVCVRIYCILANYFYIYINFTYGITYGIAPRKPRFDKS